MHGRLRTFKSTIKLPANIDDQSILMRRSCFNGKQSAAAKDRRCSWYLPYELGVHKLLKKVFTRSTTEVLAACAGFAADCCCGFVLTTLN